MYTYIQWKIQEIWNPFHRQNYLLEGIFKLLTHEQQELPFIQKFSFAYQNLAVLCVKRPWNEFRFSGRFCCCMNEFLTTDRSCNCTTKYFCKNFFRKFVVHIFTLLLAPFTSKSVTHLRQSGSLKHVWKSTNCCILPNVQRLTVPWMIVKFGRSWRFI